MRFEGTVAEGSVRNVIVRPGRRGRFFTAVLLSAALLASGCGDNTNEPQQGDTGDTVERPTLPEEGTPESTPEANRPEG